MGRNDKDALGEVIKSGRDKMNLTRDELAELVGKSPRYIASIENSDKKPSFNTLFTLIRALGVDANDIFYPENAEADSTAHRVSRLLPQCEKYEIEAVAALVETLLAVKGKI